MIDVDVKRGLFAAMVGVEPGYQDDVARRVVIDAAQKCVDSNGEVRDVLATRRAMDEIGHGRDADFMRGLELVLMAEDSMGMSCFTTACMLRNDLQVQRAILALQEMGYLEQAGVKAVE